MTITRLTRHLAIGVAASALVVCAQSASALDNAGSLQGVVKNAAGQPVTGAFVRLKNADKRLTFMVPSQAGGAYTAKDLPPGNYTVQAIGGTNQSAISAPVAVSTGKASTMDVAQRFRASTWSAAWSTWLAEERAANWPTINWSWPSAQ